jgi:uncharacterized protein YbaP (TraB family)
MRWRGGALQVVVAGCVGLAVLWSAPPAFAAPPIWTVRTAKATLVLFGSVHLLPPGLDWRPPALDQALGEATELWFELPINAESDELAAATAMRRGALPAGGRLATLLTPDADDKLRAAAAALNLSPEAVERMRPWLADLTLSVADDALSGANASDGVEEQVERAAPATAARRAFETAPQQIEFLAGAPLADQIASLNWTLSEITDDPQSYRRIVGEWLAGDVAGLERDADAPLADVSPRLYRRLIIERNRRWAKVIEARLAAGGVIVVIVGVGHLIGPDSLPAMLRAKGLEVDGP